MNFIALLEVLLVTKVGYGQDSRCWNLYALEIFSVKSLTQIK